MSTQYADASLTIGKIAAAAGLSEGYFRRLFHEFYRVSPSQYLRGLRLSHARDLLAEAELTISDIAASCGFSSAYYFSAAFRAATGISPKVWRDQHRENSK
jgi:AraC family transcriptional regulator